MIEKAVPIDHKYFTHQELLGLLAFYQTPLGQKTIEVMPKLTSESIAVGHAWGQSLQPEIVRRFQEAIEKEGIEIPNK